MARPDYKRYYRHIGAPTRIANFHWIPGTRLAGCALPGMRLQRASHASSASTVISYMIPDWVEPHARWLMDHGLKGLVCLDNLHEGALREYWKMKYTSIHVDTDMTEGLGSTQIGRFLWFMKRMDDEKSPVVICCNTGIGRTGTMLAIFLVSKGYEPLNAIERIRQTRMPCNVCNGQVFENESQRRMIAEFAVSIQDVKRRRLLPV